MNCIADTIRTIEGYADCIVLRHNLAGSAKKAAAAASVPIINAGDGPGQHPTQVLRSTISASSLGNYMSDVKLLLTQLTSPLLCGGCQIMCWAQKPAAGSAYRLIQHSQQCPADCIQALLDVYTIQQEVGHLDKLRIGLVGDLSNGRTVRSLAYLLSMYDNVKMYFVAPDVVRMKDDIKEFLSGRSALLLLCILH